MKFARSPLKTDQNHYAGNSETKKTQFNALKEDINRSAATANEEQAKAYSYKLIK